MSYGIFGKLEMLREQLVPKVSGLCPNLRVIVACSNEYVICLKGISFNSPKSIGYVVGRVLDVTLLLWE